MPLFDFFPFFKEREINTRNRSPIHFQDLLANEETYVFVHEIKQGSEIDSKEVEHLLNIASQSSNINAIFALAERYPAIVNAASVSKQLKKSGKNTDSLASGLISRKEAAPSSLSSLYTQVPQLGVTKLFDQDQREQVQSLMTSIAEFGEEVQVVVSNNSEAYDHATAMFKIIPNVKGRITPDRPVKMSIEAINDNAKAMVDDFKKWFEVSSNPELKFPNYYPASENTLKPS